MARRRLHGLLAAIAATLAFVIPCAPAANAAELSASPIDHLGRPAPHILQQARDFANQPFVPDQVRGIVLSAVAFFEGGGEGGVPLPENGPVFTQFIWPTVSTRCIDGQLNSTGTAIAVPGPAEIPAPGAAAGETAFVFTALGTGPVAATQHTTMQVQWINLNTLKTGVTPMGYHGINPQGPATLSATAPTGHGKVLAWMTGGVTVDNPNGAGTTTCNFAPTGASVDVR